MKKIYFFMLTFSLQLAFAQSNFRILQFGTGFLMYETKNNSYPYSPNYYVNSKILLGYNYTSLHKLPKTSLYFATGSKLYVINGFYLSGRMGIATNLNKEQPKFPIYFTGGMEFSVFKCGLYSTLHFAVKAKKYAFVISPEVNYLFSNLLAYSPSDLPFFHLGCGIGMAWDKKTFEPKKERKNWTINHYSADLAMGSIQNPANKGYWKSLMNFTHLTVSYRFFPKQIISPAIGLGFIAKYNAPHYVEISGPRFPHYYYIESQDNFSYLKLGIDVQTRGKIAFIAKGHIFQALTYNATGFEAQIGAKYAITPKLAISFGPEMVNYSGNVGGWYKRTREYDYLNPQNTFSDINTKGKHYSSASFYSLKLGVHFL